MAPINLALSVGRKSKFKLKQEIFVCKKYDMRKHLFIS